MVSVALGVILPVYVTICVGLLLRWVAVADDSWVEVLNRYGLYVAFPVLVFVNLTGVSGAALVARLPVYASNAALVAGVFALMTLVTRLLSVERRWANTLVICSFFGNVAYLGFPIVSGLAPTREGELAVLIAIYVTILFTAGIILLELSQAKPQRAGKLFGSVLQNPFIVAILAAVAVAATGLQVPAPIAAALSMIKASASPVVLVALGIFLGAKRDWARVAGKAALLVALKMVIFPALFILLGAVAFPGELFLPSILEAAMPIGVTLFALSSAYALEREAIAAAVVSGTTLAAISIPFVHWLWLAWFG